MFLATVEGLLVTMIGQALTFLFTATVPSQPPSGQRYIAVIITVQSQLNIQAKL